MRILIADDQPKVRLGLRVWLERLSGFEVVGAVALGEASASELPAARRQPGRSADVACSEASPTR